MKQYSTYKKIKVQPTRDDKYILLAPFTYKDVTVPLGYRTNGANIPRILWSIWPPNRSDYLPAVIMHDYLCDEEEYKLADLYFEEILIELNINKLTIWCFTKATRIYHKIKYGDKM